MKKNDMLPILAAFVIAILVFPTLALPVNALTPATGGNIGSVVTIPEDDLKRNTGVMVLGLEPTENWLYAYGTDLLDRNAPGWYTDSACTAGVVPASEPYHGTDDYNVAYVLTGPELSSEPIVLSTTNTLVYFQKVSSALCEVHYFAPPWVFTGKGYMGGMELLSQHKILATLNGVPTKPDYFLCEVIEKEKAKIPPMTTKTPSTRQFDDEIIRTTVKDVTSNFICKVWWVKPGVGVLDVYFIGPRVKNFIADHMLIITLGWKLGRTTVWASDLQDICILGWAMEPYGGGNILVIKLFKNPGKSTWPAGNEYYYSWNDPIGEFVSCDEAVAWQRAWIAGGWGF